MKIDRSSVTDLLVDYWFDVDHVAGANAHQFFSHDGTLMLGEAQFDGHAEIEAMYAARAARGPRVSRHVVGNVRVTDLSPSGDAAVVLSYVTLYAQDGAPPATVTAPVLLADVVDRVQVVDDVLRIRSRRLTPVFIGAETDVAVPLR